MSDELKVLLPDEMYILETGEQVTVRPVPFGKLNIFSEAVASLMLKISDLGLELRDIKNWKTLFDVAFEEMLNIMGLVLEKPREWFDTISINDGIGLLAIIVEQNFREETKKNILKVVEKLSSTWQTSSRYSSRQDTAGKRSRTTR
ncbi:MAG: hypothetical protein GXP46_01960 [Deferribacteres bacterium]|nr:hypothetical protein [Deferribacteres bacterium]